MLQAKATQRTLATIMFTDIVGYSALVGADEADALAKAARDIKLIAGLCADHGGRVIKNTGDGLLMHFPAAVNAVQSALEVQNQLGHVGEGHLQHRIGLHLGDVLMTDDDMLGDGVNIAARVMANADPGGICFSQTVYDVVKNAVALRATYLGARELKNIREAIPMSQIILAAAERQAAASQGGQVHQLGAMPGISPRVRHKWPAIALASAVVVLLALFSWWMINKPQGSKTAAQPAQTAGPVAIARHQAVIIGSGEYQRIGFQLPKIEPLKDQNPVLFLPDAAPPISDLRITKLHYCLQDRPGRSLPRQVDLWVPAPEGTINVTAGPTDTNGIKSIQPARSLGDGVYCVHAGALSSVSAPNFASIFIIRGFHQPSVAKTEVNSDGNQAVLKVTVANAGDGTFEEGRIFVTLQRKENDRPVFSGRWEKNIPAVAARGTLTVEFPVQARDSAPGQYYCHGWIGYPYAMDSAMALDNFESATFSLGTGGP